MKKNEEHIAVIQARMGSTRFSGKTMASIAGRPLLWHIIERLKRSVYLTKIVLATSEAKENDILEELSLKQKIFVIRGDEHDVLSRFELAFKVYKPSTITRICGDCPLVEPSFIDRSIEQIVQQDVDYLKADCSEVIHQGIETISNFCFKQNLSFKEDPIVKEHVTPLIYKKSRLYKIGKISLFDYEKKSGIRFSVDTRSDLKFIRELYRKSGKQPSNLSIKEALDLIDRDPSLLAYNEHVIQKSARQKTEYIYFYHKGLINEYFLKLAQDYAEKKGFGVKFFTSEVNSKKIVKLKSYGFKVKHLKNDGEFFQIVFKDSPELIYLPLISLPKELSDLYALKNEKKRKVYKLIKC